MKKINNNKQENKKIKKFYKGSKKLQIALGTIIV